MGNSSSKTLPELNNYIISAELDKEGNLIFKKKDNSNLGPFKVKGDPGVGITDASVDDNGVLNMSLTDGKFYEFPVRGKDGINGKDGKDGKDGINGKDGFTGPTGVAGRPGNVGSQGLRGEKGDTGPIGAQGIQGLVGAQGIQGIQGEKGDIGPVGPQGIQGLVGLTGSNGARGEMGIRGMQGEKGNVGSAGPIGPTGPTGPIGPAGGIPGFTQDRVAKTVNAISKDDDGWTRVEGGKNGIAMINGLSTDQGINVGNWVKAPKGRVQATSLSVGESHLGEDWASGVNIRNGNGSWTHFNTKNESNNYIRGDTIVDGKINVNTICAADGNHCVNLWDIVNSQARYAIQNNDNRRLQMSGDGARATGENNWGSWEAMRLIKK